MTRTVLLVGAMAAAEHCGVSDYLRRLAGGLRESGVTVALLCTERQTAGDEASGAISYSLPDWRWRNFRALHRLLRSTGADLVHIHFPSRGFGKRTMPWLLPLICRQMGLPVVVTLHEPVSLARIYRLVLVLLANAPLISVRRRYREESGPLQRWLLRRREIHFIRSASTLPSVSLDASEKTSLRDALGCTGRLLLFFGFLYPAKGAHLLLELRLRDEDCIVLAGAEPDQSYADALREEAATRTSGGRVQLLGPVEARYAASLIAAADALILPFENGGGEWNTTIMAGIDNGTFVLTTSRDRRGYDAEDDVYFAPPGAIDELGAALEDRLAGRLVPDGYKRRGDPWLAMAREHDQRYQTLLPASDTPT